MISLSQQELEICYILSGIFNYYTSYAEILGDINQDVADYKTGEKHYARYAYLIGKEECFTLFRVKQKYKQVVKEVLAIKSNFSQKDLEELFYITASYCLKNKFIFDEFSWAMEEGWDKKEFMEGLSKMKEISYFQKKYIDFRVKNHYRILCFMFNFTKHSLEEQKQMLKKDSSIHYNLFQWKLIMAIFTFFLVIILFLLRIVFDFVENGEVVGALIFFLAFVLYINFQNTYKKI